jgi:hypothetical protein
MDASVPGAAATTDVMAAPSILVNSTIVDLKVSVNFGSCSKLSGVTPDIPTVVINWQKKSFSSTPAALHVTLPVAARPASHVGVQEVLFSMVLLGQFPCSPGCRRSASTMAQDIVATQVFVAALNFELFGSLQSEATLSLQVCVVASKI